MWVFYHPLATIRSDSTVKRALDPKKVKLTQESYGLSVQSQRVYSKYNHCLETQARNQRHFRLQHPGSHALSRKSQRHMGPAIGATLVA